MYRFNPDILDPNIYRNVWRYRYSKMCKENPASRDGFILFEKYSYYGTSIDDYDFILLCVKINVGSLKGCLKKTNQEC